MTQSPSSASKSGWPRRLRRWSLELLLLIAIIGGVQWWQTRGVAEGPAPALQGMLLDGHAVSLQALQGQPVLVHFWATWCPICRLEEDSIDALARDHQVITIATTSGDAAAVRAYLQQQGLHFPVLLDETGEVGRAWGVKGVPASFIIDPAGDVVHATVGYTTGIGLRLRLWLAGL